MLSKSLYQTTIAMSESEPSLSTWTTGDRTSVTFGARTSSMAPLVSSQRAHDLHGDTPDAVDASILSSLSLSRQNSGHSKLTVARSLQRAQTRSSLRCSPLELTYSFAVTCSPSSTRRLAVKPSGEPTFPTSPKSGRRDLLLRRTQCRAPRSLSSSLVRT